jgi:hypothetical protein
VALAPFPISFFRPNLDSGANSVSKGQTSTTKSSRGLALNRRDLNPDPSSAGREKSEDRSGWL